MDVLRSGQGTEKKIKWLPVLWARTLTHDMQPMMHEHESHPLHNPIWSGCTRLKPQGNPYPRFMMSCVLVVSGSWMWTLDGLQADTKGSNWCPVGGVCAATLTYDTHTVYSQHNHGICMLWMQTHTQVSVEEGVACKLFYVRLNINVGQPLWGNTALKLRLGQQSHCPSRECEYAFASVCLHVCVGHCVDWAQQINQPCHPPLPGKWIQAKS